MWITWKKQDCDSWFSRVDYQTGVNECAYAFSEWNTVGLKYMLLSLYKIYSRFAWIRNFWDFVQGALKCTDSWLWRCSVISWLSLCKKFHTLYYLASELWYHWGYKCKHKRKGGWSSSPLSLAGLFAAMAGVRSAWGESFPLSTTYVQRQPSSVATW